MVAKEVVSLNAQEKLNIEHMRNEGLSYKVIAQKLRLSVCAVKSYCVRHDLGGRRAPGGRHQTPDMDDFCEECGSIIVQQKGRKHKRFCCDDCRMQWWTKHRAADRAKETAAKKKQNDLPSATSELHLNIMAEPSVRTIPPHEEPIRITDTECQLSAEQFIAEYIYYICRIVLMEMRIKGIIEECETSIVLSVLIDIFMPPISSIYLNTRAAF